MDHTSAHDVACMGAHGGSCMEEGEGASWVGPYQGVGSFLGVWVGVEEGHHSLGEGQGLLNGPVVFLSCKK